MCVWREGGGCVEDVGRTRASSWLSVCVCGGGGGNRREKGKGVKGVGSEKGVKGGSERGVKGGEGLKGGVKGDERGEGVKG